MASVLEPLERVAEFRGLLVILARDGVVEFGFQPFPMGERQVGAQLLQPGFEHSHFAGLLGVVGVIGVAEQVPDRFDTCFDGPDGASWIIGLEGEGALGSSPHEQDLRFEDSQTGRDVRGIRVFLDQVEDFEVSFGITQHGRVIAELKEADVPVVVLQGLLLEALAILRFELKSGVIAVLSDVLAQPRLIEVHPGVVAHGTFAIGPAFGLHLEDTKIDSKLEFLAPIASLETTYSQFTGLIIPLAQEIRQVVTHSRSQFATADNQVNGSKSAQGIQYGANPRNFMGSKEVSAPQSGQDREESLGRPDFLPEELEGMREGMAHRPSQTP